MKYLATTFYAALLALTANAQKAGNNEKTEVSEFLNDGKSTIIFAAPNNKLMNDLDDVFSEVERDYPFVSELEINSETNNISIVCTKDIGLVEVSQLMKVFEISKYHYSWEVDTSAIGENPKFVQADK